MPLLSAHRHIDVVRSGPAWLAIDDQGVTVVMKGSKEDTIDVASNAGTSDLPVVIRIHRADGTVEAERTFPEAERGAVDPVTRLGRAPLR